MSYTRKCALLALFATPVLCGLGHSSGTKDEQAVKQFEGHRACILAIAFSPDGKTLASGGWDNNIRISDVITGNCTRSMEQPDVVTCAAFSPDGKTLAASGWDKKVRILGSWRRSRFLHFKGMNAK